MNLDEIDDRCPECGAEMTMIHPSEYDIHVYCDECGYIAGMETTWMSKIRTRIAIMFRKLTTWWKQYY